MHKRILRLISGFMVLLLLLVMRLGYLQLFRGEQLGQEAAQQRRVEIWNSGLRGEITDRNFYPLTSHLFLPVALISPEEIGHPEMVYKSLTPYIRLSQAEFLEKIEEGLPFTIPLRSYPTSSPFEGVEYTRVQKRYDKDSLAKHLLGYCYETENTGAAGLERAFDEQLRTSGEESVGVITNARYEEIDGSSWKIQNDPETKRMLRLTLDVTCQNIVEEVAKKEIPRGAVVVLDVTNGNVLAMVSQPQFDPEDVGQALQTEGGALLNRALRSFDAGSVFKIVVAAAGLEAGLIDLEEEYHCQGFVQIGEKRVTCFDGKAHGEINFFEAFTRSCNSCFIDLGNRLGPDKILDMAERFGVQQPADLFENSGEEVDEMVRRETYYAGDLANLSIGQGDVRMTPLAVAQLSAIIASGGVRHQNNVVDSLLDGNKETVTSFLRNGSMRVISEDVAAKIQSMMYFTTAVGTAKAANLDAYGGAACKTGTAQTGWQENGETKVHSWVTGYFPVEHPRYAVAVLIENGQNEKRSATTVFHQIAMQMMERMQ